MTTELPISIVWSKMMFLEESLGRAVFPDVLEGRERSSFLLTKPVEPYIQGIRRWDYPRRANVFTVGDLLAMMEASVIPWLQRPQSKYLEIIKESLSDSLREVAFGPEDRLMQAIFGGSPNGVLISPLLEPGRKIRIMDVLKTLSDKENHVIQLRYGISIIAPMVPEGIARAYNMTHLDTRHMTRLGVRQIVGKALRKLQHPSRSNKLREFLPSK